MNRLRNRLILAFMAATVVPLAATLWITTSLLDRSLSYTTTRELDELSKSLEQTARELGALTDDEEIRTPSARIAITTMVAENG